MMWQRPGARADSATKRGLEVTKGRACLITSTRMTSASTTNASSSSIASTAPARPLMGPSAGAASALAGLLLALVAFGIGLWLGRALDGSTRPMMAGLFWSAATALVAWTLVRRALR